jgi:hypothetical protein
MKGFFIALASIFTSCIFPTKQALECDGILIPYTGHPVEKVRKKMSTQNSQVPRTDIVVLANPLRSNT